MRSRKLLVLALMAVAFAWAGAVALAGYVEIEPNPPDDPECLCPANWDPVVCKGPDGSRHVFSNACVAGCNGFTKCASVTIVGP